MTILTKKRSKRNISEVLWKVAEDSVIESEVTTVFSTNGQTEPVPIKPIQTVTLSPEEEDPFYYGWRYEWIEQPDGTTLVNKIPLPLERFLDPQMGDFFVQSDPHYTLTDSIHDSYDNRYDDDEKMGVFSDLKMVWGIPGLEEPAPDVAIIPSLKEPKKARSTFNVLEEKTRPCLIIEVSSPRYPVEDKKIPIYEQAGVQEYIIVDAHWGNSKKELEFKGYKRVNGLYQPMVKDAQGRLYSEATDTYLFFETEEGKVLSYITDGTTGEQMLDNRGSHRARLIEAIGRRSAEQLARQATKRAEESAANLKVAEKQARTATEKAVMETIEREAAEERAEAEAAERRMAEERAEAEAAERRMAEERAEAEVAAKLAAEERAEAETAERLAAEQRMKEALAKIAELEAQLAEK